ncbi:hypothetical protein DH2020_002537 [Rehmannia glutinosa]|uniref:PGG domain-containing protein n=1 Tax=Rehmannia glutinosa TaxID=99300 RepID=A0ABR0XU02_REHGL
MDQRMFSAACSGDVNALHQLLQENPFILSDYTLINSNNNPLTIATKANHLNFVREILRLKPQLATELNQDGIRPLDIASAYGYVEIVRDILATTGPEICRLGGKNGKTAIHYAAVNGRIEIIDLLMSVCSECVKDVTSFGETALHLAVKHFKFEALRNMLQWVEKVDMVEVVNWGDKDGNTVLHYAVLNKQLENIELLVDWNNTSQNKFELNAANEKGLTPLDIADILTESSNDIHLREVLHRAGAYTSSEFHIISQNPKPQTTKNRFPSKKPQNWLDIVRHFEFQWQRDSPGEARETLLLVAALIATVTFEAGINPPSYLFESSNESNVTITSPNVVGSNNTTELLNEIRRSGRETSTMVSITVFLMANSVALSTATSIIDYLTAGLPFQRELRVSMFAMIFAYGWSLGSTRPTGLVKNVLLVFALCMPLFLRWLPYVITRLRKAI